MINKRKNIGLVFAPIKHKNPNYSYSLLYLRDCLADLFHLSNLRDSWRLAFVILGINWNLVFGEETTSYSTVRSGLLYTQFQMEPCRELKFLIPGRG